MNRVSCDDPVWCRLRVFGRHQQHCARRFVWVQKDHLLSTVLSTPPWGQVGMGFWHVAANASNSPWYTLLVSVWRRLRSVQPSSFRFLSQFETKRKMASDFVWRDSQFIAIEERSFFCLGERSCIAGDWAFFCYCRECLKREEMIPIWSRIQQESNSGMKC